MQREIRVFPPKNKSQSNKAEKAEVFHARATRIESQQEAESFPTLIELTAKPRIAMRRFRTLFVGDSCESNVKHSA